MSLSASLTGSAKSIFQSKTFWSATAGLFTVLAPVGMNVVQHGAKPEDLTQAGLALLAYGATVASRVAATSPLYTPNGVPGPNQSDFAAASSETSTEP